MSQSLRILLAEPDRFDEEAASILESLGDVERRALEQDELGAALKQYDVIWFRLRHRVTRDMVNSGVRCRVLASPVTGLDHIDLEACCEAGIEVASLKGETEFLRNIRATAELTLALTLALLRKLPQAAESVKSGNWQRDLFPGRELYGKTAGIVGVGRLGSIVAGYFRTFGMDVIGYDPRPDFPEGVAQRATALEELLCQSDVVSLHVTFDESTRNLIDGDALAAMRPEAILVNTSRGGVVDESALLEALRTDRIVGAALDVLGGEPDISTDHPLIAYAREHDNLLIVPHLGGNTTESWQKTERFLAGKIVEIIHAQGVAP